MFSVEELEDGSNKYYVKSKADYEAAVKSLVYPQGFAEYEGMAFTIKVINFPRFLSHTISVNFM